MTAATGPPDFAAISGLDGPNILRADGRAREPSVLSNHDARAHGAGGAESAAKKPGQALSRMLPGSPRPAATSYSPPQAPDRHAPCARHGRGAARGFGDSDSRAVRPLAVPPRGDPQPAGPLEPPRATEPGSGNRQASAAVRGPLPSSPPSRRRRRDRCRPR